MVVSGALTQLAAVGPQDRYLDIDPQITFWKGTTKRYAMFSVAENWNDFQGSVGTGKKLTAVISRSGDLIWHTYFYFQVGPIEYSEQMVSDGFQNNVAYYTNAIGFAIIEAINYEIGGHSFDNHSGEYLDIWEQVSSTWGHRLGPIIGKADSLDQLIEYGRSTQHIYTPLIFDWNRYTEDALPLIALQYHEVKVNIKLRCANELIVRSGEANNPNTLALPGEFSEWSLLVGYVFLDAMERRAFAQSMHEYIITELQHTGSESHQSGVTNQHIRLDFNHPIIELFWLCQRDGVIQPIPYTGPGAQSGGGGNDWFNYSGNYDPLTSIIYDPIIAAELVLNGHSRTLDHPSIYYRRVVPRAHHTRQPDGFIYNYCFSLYPEDRQPSGACNFSRIDNVTLRLTFPSAYNTDSAVQALPFNGQIRVLARGYNVMRIVSGMAGKLYAN
jgi:hypothetical protein